ncbi:MAG TPA: hypothetical protein VD886_11120, partial [Herpetosiphonaceae bacterium]|nr:hypothetical protein [Herpetosiphonaceae bacterium]
VNREAIGGINTHAAMALATHLQTAESGTQVWFIVPPRMFYHGFAMLDFLARDVKAADVLEPIASAQAVPPASSEHPTLYVFSPERLGEIEYVQQAYPNGRLIPLTWMYHAEPLLFGYQIDPAR